MSPIGRRMRACAALALGLCIAHGAVADIAERLWREYESAHFRLVSDLPREQARQRVIELERFRATVRHITGIADEGSGFRTRVYLFARNRDFRDLFDERYVGFFHARLESNYLVADGGATLDQRSVLFHEYVHFLIREHSTEFYPEWYNEGLAELLATVHEAGGEMVFGAPPPRVEALRTFEIPLESVIHGDSRSLDPLELSKFYAGAWALVHYLHIGHLAGGAMRLPQLHSYLELCNEGMSSEAAFEKAFDVSEQELAAEIRRYLRRGQKPRFTLAAEQFEIDETISERALATEEIAYELGYIVLPWDPERARRLFSHLTADTREDPHKAAATTITHLFAEEYPEGAAVGRDAVDHGELEHYLPMLKLANLLYAWCQAGEPESHCRALLAEAQSLYERALELEPGDVRLRYGLAVTLASRGQEIDTAYRLLEEITAERPWHDRLNYELALVALKAGRIAEAETHLRRAASFTHDEALSRRARELRAQLPALSETEQPALTRSDPP